MAHAAALPGHWASTAVDKETSSRERRLYTLSRSKYTARAGPCGKPRVVSYNRCPRRKADRTGRSEITEHTAVGAVGGPTRLMLASGLALARADAAIVERRAVADGVLVRSCEVLCSVDYAQRGS